MRAFPVLVTCAIFLLLAASDAPAQPPLPKKIGDLLERAGMAPRSGEGLLGNLHPGLQVPPAKDSELAELMARARREDVILPGTHPIFGQQSIDLGLWQSSYFLDNYGTALFLDEPYDEDRIPLVLVHGINGSPRDFTNLVARFRDSPYQPVLFFYPSGMPLADAAKQLGIRLQELVGRHDVERFGIIAHSMGGLVAKGMLDQFDVTTVLPAWRLFVAISTPWGGVDAAQYSGRLPRHPPAWDDMPSTSEFSHRILKTPFPEEVPFYLFFGARSSRSLLSALGNNDGVLTLDTVVGTPVTGQARDVFGFYEDHTSVLTSPAVHHRIEGVLTKDLSP